MTLFTTAASCLAVLRLKIGVTVGAGVGGNYNYFGKIGKNCALTI